MAINKMQSLQAWQGQRQRLSQWWQSLGQRDKWALALLAVFLVVVVGGMGGYELSSRAQKAQARYQSAITDYFWLRDQAGNINPNMDTPAQNEPPAAQISQLLQQVAITNPQVMSVGDTVQVAFSHDNQAVISNLLNALIQAGYKIPTLTMQQNLTSKAIDVQMTVVR